MFNIGVIPVSGSIRDNYINALKTNETQVIEVLPSEINKKMEQVDAVIINDDTQENVAQICSILLELKADRNPLVWVMTKEPNPVNRLIFLQLGADGNLNSQVDPNEFKLIINNAINRQANNVPSNQLKKTPVVEKQSSFELIDQNVSVVIDNEREIPLTKLEYQLLKILYSKPNVAFTYEELFKRLWKKPDKNYKFRVSNLVFHLRKKMENNPDQPQFIITVRSKGYFLNLT
ncbi:winged helix-turn-helix domain-containing protein [Enterococcus sp. LJL128]|uniref:winged helix-turn-helix domain-containing protein n=1 Tax=Enterococcus sp. LJL51 TaxID=3416656 RepID=UPI003CF7BC05